MSTERTIYNQYSPYYRGPRNEADYRRWLDGRARKMKRRYIWAILIGTALPFIVILAWVNLTGF